MNKIKLENLYDLPMNIEHDGKTYSLEIFVTAWDNFCICYRTDLNPFGNNGKLFSIVIDPDTKTIFTSDDPYAPDTVRTFDEAYTLLYNTLVVWNYIDIEEEFDHCEESALEPYVDADELELPKLR